MSFSDSLRFIPVAFVLLLCIALLIWVRRSPRRFTRGSLAAMPQYFDLIANSDHKAVVITVDNGTRSVDLRCRDGAFSLEMPLVSDEQRSDAERFREVASRLGFEPVNENVDGLDIVNVELGNSVDEGVLVARELVRRLYDIKSDDDVRIMIL
jgi:hypothetical protein